MMADNGTDEQTQQTQPAAIDFEAFRPLLKEIIADELNAALDPIMKRLEKNEQVAAENSRRVSEAFMRITALDLSYRDLQNRSVEAINIANQIVGKFENIRESLDVWTAAAAANSKAIVVLQEGYIDLQQDVHGDPAHPHSKSVMGELEKLPAHIKGAIKEELNPVVNRLAINESRTMKVVEWIEQRSKIEQLAKTMIGFVFSRKTLAVIAGGTGLGAAVAELLRAMGGG